MNYFSAIILFFLSAISYALPSGFVYLQDIDSSIQQDIRYAGFHNFVGRPIQGYDTASCILTKEAASALSKIQNELKKSALSLKVYDCYRPTKATKYFMNWSENSEDHLMKKEFYPRVNKADLFKLKYVAEKSGHSRGSTVDLTIIPLQSHATPYHPGQPLQSCIALYGKRYRDNGIDMGTGYDCMDIRSHSFNKHITSLAYKQRIKLRAIMKKYGFALYSEEWWHFTLKNEPYPSTYFDFTIVQRKIKH